MRNLSGNQIREEFLRFFEGKGHRRVHSSSLVPANDPTLLFTNAGMNQFKDVFLGAETRGYSRAASSQKCVRAGGKHNDLENVGFTRRHHTFFEMLGNFSFGDYFKREAIAFAWELLTSEEWFGIEKDRLYVTVFAGEGTVPRDDEAERLWIEAGVPKERIFTMGMKDNFWQMGDTGPCGPCSEIFFDLGLAASETGEDKPFGEDDQRFMEIWNLVFMQFDRAVDHYECPEHPDRKEPNPFDCRLLHKDKKYKDKRAAKPVMRLDPLPKPSIDTGMGLERVAAVLQGKISNYESDLFLPLIKRAAQLTNTTLTIKDLEGGLAEALAIVDLDVAASMRIIADHARAATFLISDGIVPSNEGRGYVLRKIIRRAIRHGLFLGTKEPFFYQMVFAVRDLMQGAYPELIESAKRVSEIVLAEERQFSRVLSVGLSELRNAIKELYEKDVQGIADYVLEVSKRTSPKLISEFGKAVDTAKANGTQLAPDDIRGFFVSALGTVVGEPLYREAMGAQSKRRIFDGRIAFGLYETFGLPVDLIEEAVRDSHFKFDREGFEAAKEQEQERARASWKGGSQKSAAPVYRELAKTEFEGYTALRVDGARVLALVKDGLGVQVLQPGEVGEVVLDATSFYADSGGQVGDVGWLTSPGGRGGDHQTVVAEVTGCKKPVQGVFAHQVVVKQTMAVGDVIDTVVDGEVRAAVMRNHTGTHLLHAALRQVLGTHVKQAGSLNDRSRLRFDFSHFAGVAEEELAEIESLVNAQVLKNTPVVTLVDVPIDEAVQTLGAMALFGEKYGDKVRVVRIGEFSTELCGGTHTAATGEIGLVKLVGEGAVASGVRRVEAVTGMGALGLFRRDADVARVASSFVGTGEVSGEALRVRVAHQEEEMKKLRRELETLRMKSATAATADAASSAVLVKGVKVLSLRVDALDKSQMRNLVDELRGKLGSGVVVLGAVADGRVSLIVGVSKDLVGRVQAGKIVGLIAAKVGGKGGGRPDLAEAGGSDVAGLDAALGKATDVVGGLLG